ncbi:MAG: DUF3592 domain-containing protein [Desulfatibacillum sp.]|nr:DUF3592 domain-containing protein [Desulfatibacillum sp.]
MSSDRKTGIGGRLFMTLFGLIFFAAGCFFAWLILSETWENYQTRSWEQTPCLITDSRVDVVGDGYEFRVGYQYSFQGRHWSSYQYRLGDKATFDKVAEADSLARKYSPGSEAVCYVNPRQPGQSILAHNSLGQGFMIFLPLIFVAIGLGVMISAWTGSSKPKREPRSKADSGDSWKGRLGLAGFFSIFFLAGALIAYFFFLPALIGSLTSGDWTETECTILSSRVKTHDGDDGDTYSVDILYTYNADGQELRSNRYGFIGGSSSGYSGKMEIVRRYPPGSRATCYVNPNDHKDAVLTTSLGGEALFGLIPLIFMMVGGGGILYALFSKGNKGPSYRRKIKDPHAPFYSSDGAGAPGRQSMGGVQVLKPKSSALGKVFGALFAAIFWNGIVSVFVVHVVNGWIQGRGSIGLTLFISIFVIVGIIIIFSFFRNLMALFNPKLTITLLSDFVCLGDEVKLNWEFRGNANKISRFSITLTGEESASYTRGTDRVTETHNFFKMVVADHSNSAFMQKGEARLEIPAETMHSFKSSNNAITWTLRAHCDIPKWPDTKDDYPIDIHPLQEGHFS